MNVVAFRTAPPIGGFSLIFLPTHFLTNYHVVDAIIVLQLLLKKNLTSGFVLKAWIPFKEVSLLRCFTLSKSGYEMILVKGTSRRLNRCFRSR